jgi:hypothetical protein
MVPDFLRKSKKKNQADLTIKGDCLKNIITKFLEERWTNFTIYKGQIFLLHK